MGGVTHGTTSKIHAQIVHDLKFSDGEKISVILVEISVFKSEIFVKVVRLGI